MRALSISVPMAMAAALLAINPFVAPGPQSTWDPPASMPIPPPVGTVFPDYPQLFGYIAAATGLGKNDDAELAQRLNSSSSIDHLHDYSGESILVVKPELLAANDTSRVRSATGNYRFFVFRDTGTGYMLLGEMEGRSYKWSIPNRHLQFQVSATTQNHRTTSDRYEVNTFYLANLTELAKSEKRHERVVIDLRRAIARR